MKNWLGQEIEQGTVVYRGARSGNSSIFIIGVVMDVIEENRKARVDWKYFQDTLWISSSPGNRYRINYPGTTSAKSTLSIDTLVVTDVAVFDNAALRYQLAHDAYTNRMPEHTYLERLEQL